MLLAVAYEQRQQVVQGNHPLDRQSPRTDEARTLVRLYQAVHRTQFPHLLRVLLVLAARGHERLVLLQLLADVLDPSSGW
jgi:hypothetical protein